MLDDTHDEYMQEQSLVETECQRWGGKGVNIKYEIRDSRNGYKAGALKQGLKHSYVKQCDYVVIFDADFQPESDFLWRTIPFLLHNPQLALVQTRWKFGTFFHFLIIIIFSIHLVPSLFKMLIYF